MQMVFAGDMAYKTALITTPESKRLFLIPKSTPSETYTDIHAWL